MCAPDNFSLEIQPYCKNCQDFEVYDDMRGIVIYHQIGNIQHVTEPAKHVICCKYSKRCKEIYERIKEELSNEGS